jgi:hypothetical protein
MPPSARSDVDIIAPTMTATSKTTSTTCSAKRARFSYFRGLNIFGTHASEILYSDPALLEPCASEERKVERKRQIGPSSQEHNRSVSFAPTAKVIAGDERFEDEIRACWCSKDDMKMYRADAIISLQKLASLRGRCGYVFDDDENLTSLGLEQNMALSIHNMRRNRVESHIALLREQEFQVEEGNPDAMALASIYSDYTSTPRTLALLRAHDLEFEVKKTHIP